MAERLTHLRMSELSGVDHGANELDGFMVMKALTPEQREAVLKAAGDMQASHENLYESLCAVQDSLTEAPQEVQDAHAVLMSYCEEMLGEGESGAPSQQMDGADKADKAPYGDVTYADEGYQSDKKKRYPLDTERHIRAAWGYINQEDNKAKYSADDYKKVRDKIAAAMKKIGADVEKRGILAWVTNFLKQADEETELDISADDLREALGLVKAEAA